MYVELLSSIVCRNVHTTTLVHTTFRDHVQNILPGDYQALPVNYGVFFEGETSFKLRSARRDMLLPVTCVSFHVFASFLVHFLLIVFVCFFAIFIADGHIVRLKRSV